MKLNGIACGGWRWVSKDSAEFSLSDTTVTGASAIDGQDIRLTEDDGETVVASFAGHAVTGVWADGDAIRVRTARALDTESAKAIQAVEDNIGVVSAKADAAQTTADEAKQAAAEAGNPQFTTFAALALTPMAADMSDADALKVSSLWPEWSADSKQYAVDVVVKYNGNLYRCEQAHTSQASWTPDASASLWSRIDVAGDGVDVWTQPNGAHNAYNTGDRVHYPDADGPIYVSTIDGNVWAPDAYPQGWQLEDAE